jgi:uncharacterized protein (TIGR03435 family)
MRYLTLLLAPLGMALAQDAAQPRLSFEVAAIRPHEGPLSRTADFSISGPRVAYIGYSPFLLIMEAYNIRNYQLSVASQKLPLDDYYEIVANAPRAVTRDESRLMLRALLADRFKLQFHREARETAVYELVLDKNGPSLKPGSGGAACASRIGPVQPQDRNYQYQFTNCALDVLVNSLQADRPIVDKTGLSGQYDITLSATPPSKMRDSTEPGDIDVSDAIRRLGLRLEARRVSIEVLVVDHLEKPTNN